MEQKNAFASAKVKAEDGRKLQGSVDIDACTKGKYPNDARWDYAIGYDGKAMFVEVHPANTSNVREMESKVAILKNSPQYRRLAKHHLQITKVPFILK